MKIPFLSAILDAADRSRGRRDLSYFGRATPGDEDRLMPQSDRDTTAQRCHDMRRNNPVISGACDRVTDNVVGAEIIMQARTSDPGWNAKAERWLKNWSRAIDPERRTSLTTAATPWPYTAKVPPGEAVVSVSDLGQFGCWADAAPWAATTTRADKTNFFMRASPFLRSISPAARRRLFTSTQPAAEQRGVRPQT